jgi:hypothetical protein
LREENSRLNKYYQNFAEPSDDAIDTVAKYFGDLPSPHTEIFLSLIGGQASRAAEDSTAYSQRDALWACNVHGRWETAEEDQKVISWRANSSMHPRHTPQAACM